MSPAATGSEPRTLAPPERRVAELVSNEGLGAYRVLRALDRHGPRRPRPGQFYMLATGSRWGGGADERPYLPRAFSYARAREVSDGVELDFLLEDVGPGTARLAELVPGEGLALVGPLGVGFREPDGGVEPVLVGGGIGVAPLLCLAETLPDAPVLLGFRSAEHAEAAGLFGGRAEVATDDGSVGHGGIVTELLERRLEGAGVYACGPPAMLEAVRSLCAERSLPAQLALEMGMACGFGACFGCAVPTRDGLIRLCLEGPVLGGERLDSAIFPGGGHQG